MKLNKVIKITDIRSPEVWKKVHRWPQPPLFQLYYNCKMSANISCSLMAHHFKPSFLNDNFPGVKWGFKAAKSFTKS